MMDNDDSGADFPSANTTPPKRPPARPPSRDEEPGRNIAIWLIVLIGVAVLVNVAIYVVQHWRLTHT